MRLSACLSATVLAASLSGVESLGLRPPTADEQQWMDANLVEVDAVQFNRLGLERVNQERLQSGQALVSVTPAEDSHEMTGRTRRQQLAGQPRLASAPSAAASLLPSSVDNTTLDAFPPIGNQGGLGSCASFSTTYYTMTFMIARARGIDAKHLGPSAIRSPKFIYNLINAGSNSGTWITSAYHAQIYHGAPSLATWPYDADYVAWPTAASVWRDGIPYRMSTTGLVTTLDGTTGLTQLKTMLTNGYILNFATDIYGWNFTTLGNDPATSADDALVGQHACSYASSNDSAHAMTVVGYNDDLWIDLNGNGVVDAGEKGALKVVNSWGAWRNQGSAWISYDALKPNTAVTG